MELPSDFCRQMEKLLGAEYLSFLSSLKTESPVSVRINRSKWKESLSLNPVAWCPDGCYLEQRPSFTFDPLLHAGAYYVQEASSMFLYQVVLQLLSEPVKALDLCAAPGGKSTLLLSSLPQGSLLVANEVIRNRAQVLNENIKKWGNPDAVVTNNNPADFVRLPHYFDFILADVPCSGEGMFRKDPDTVAEWSLENVSSCAVRQRQIIEDVWPALKPGGILVYSTCTYNTEENEENIQWICSELGAESVPLNLGNGWNIAAELMGSASCYRFFPHKIKGEGFFMAVLRKQGKTMQNEAFNLKVKGKKQSIVRPENVCRWIRNSDDYQFNVSDSVIKAYSSVLKEDILKIEKLLKSLSSGLTVATFKGKEWAPAHDLALSAALDSSAFPVAELAIEEAIRYLRKETVTLSGTLPVGYVLLTFLTIPLGWVKNIGNRNNNLYPQEYRIKTTYTPPALKTIF
ncbi:MAG: rRNA cytosine-C5-methyltransferase [Bacteroidales bacterium]|nr:rRNA cytosine-C5-methyltransferase [Bacteroidales bacterium]